MHRQRPRPRAEPWPVRHAGLVIHAGFLLLLVASLGRYTVRHGTDGRAPWVFALAVLLGLLYLAGLTLPKDRSPARLAWLAAVLAAWLALVTAAPSFAWCAVPLLYTGLRVLPTRAAIGTVVLLTTAVVIAQYRLADTIDPSLFLGPPAVAAIATAVFTRMRSDEERLRETVAELAVSERRAGVLAERERLSREIHDTIAQGTSSLRMLLQAADRTWDTDPAAARAHVRRAEEVAALGVEEIRRFVRDLAPVELAGDTGLAGGLVRVVERFRVEGGPDVALAVDGRVRPLTEPVEAALTRTAQGALANVREHARARAVHVTLTYLPDRVALDIRDDGVGFDPGLTRVGDLRGYGLPSLRRRLAEVGGELTLESAPGEGTALAATVPDRPNHGDHDPNAASGPGTDAAATPASSTDRGATP
ncbi:sensor histidine kinase [Embleya sp. NBC_00896]|uniref:sensor histidine kinase n=1 Tax=Embleya sp. NBC_00896 TaxID=2975961 RepID=UPI003870ED3D|nr:sensor histidine kinase [Embleya sp. NBC_00896]